VTSQVRHATIQASVPNVSKNWTKEEKAQALHDALVSQGDKQSVGGQPLIEIGDTTGTGFLVAPGADRQSTMPDGSVEGANNLQIEDARVKDSHTHAHDVVQEPPKGAAGASAIAMISMSGGITGMDPDGQPSEISIFTNLGEAVVALDGTMTPLDAAEDLVDQLKALGIDAVLDRDRGSILVVLTDQVGGISAGPTMRASTGSRPR